jgi:predicted nucleic-acid-binding protein
MRAVDTNMLVRLITRDDLKQVAAGEAFVAPGAWVPHLALAEAAWVLVSVYGRGPEEVATAIEMLLSHERLSVQDAEVVAAAVAQFRRHPRVGFSDCLMLEIARKAGHTPLGTFDRDLGKIAGAQRLA